MVTYIYRAFGYFILLMFCGALSDHVVAAPVPPRLFINVAVVSVGAFDLQLSAKTATGKYLYSYLAPGLDHNPVGVRSATYRVEISENLIHFTDESGHKCRPWHLVRLTQTQLSAKIGSVHQGFALAPGSAYEVAVKGLYAMAKTLGTARGGVEDWFKPSCQSDAFALH